MRTELPLTLFIFITTYVMLPLNTEGSNRILPREIVATIKGITCWTCPEMRTNAECNDWAPDRICPGNKTICKTVHILDKQNKSSLQVSKVCASEDQCDEKTVGCKDSIGQYQTECIACCNISYCNQDIPFNNSHAWILSMTFNGSGIICASNIFIQIMVLIIVLYTYCESPGT